MSYVSSKHSVSPISDIWRVTSDPEWLNELVASKFRELIEKFDTIRQLRLDERRA